MIFVNDRLVDDDTAIRRISDMWADKTGDWDHFDLISKFLREKNLANLYVMFVESEIEKLAKYNNGETEDV